MYDISYIKTRFFMSESETTSDLRSDKGRRRRKARRALA